MVGWFLRLDAGRGERFAWSALFRLPLPLFREEAHLLMCYAIAACIFFFLWTADCFVLLPCLLCSFSYLVPFPAVVCHKSSSRWSSYIFFWRYAVRVCMLFGPKSQILKAARAGLSIRGLFVFGLVLFLRRSLRDQEGWRAGERYAQKLSQPWVRSYGDYHLWRPGNSLCSHPVASMRGATRHSESPETSCDRHFLILLFVEGKRNVPNAVVTVYSRSYVSGSLLFSSRFLCSASLGLHQRIWRLFELSLF